MWAWFGKGLRGSFNIGFSEVEMISDSQLEPGRGTRPKLRARAAGVS